LSMQKLIGLCGRSQGTFGRAMRRLWRSAPFQGGSSVCQPVRGRISRPTDTPRRSAPFQSGSSVRQLTDTPKAAAPVRPSVRQRTGLATDGHSERNAQSAAAGARTAGSFLRDAVRLSLRSGAGPLRSLGWPSVRPRPHEFVPLIMAVRLDPVRLLIADDVGVGKTIQGALIARKLLDRGDAQRICVPCPPQQKERRNERTQKCLSRCCVQDRP